MDRPPLIRGNPVEHHLQVPRTARYYTIGGEDHSIAEIWYALHGYRQLAGRFVHYFAGIATPRRRIVAPEGLSRFYLEPRATEPSGADPVGASWMTREGREREIEDYVEYLDRLTLEDDTGAGRGDAVATVLGFSQGVHTACRWIALGRTPPPARLILWGTDLPRDLHRERFASRMEGRELVWVRGRDDPHATGEMQERFEKEVAEMGLAARVELFEGGHRLDRTVLRRLAGE